MNSLPFQNLPDAYPEEWIESLRWVEENLDFDTLVPRASAGPRGPRRMSPRSRLSRGPHRRGARRPGAGLADNSPEMVEAVRTELEPTYGDWANFEEWLPENIQGLLAAWANASASPAPASAAP